MADDDEEVDPAAFDHLVMQVFEEQEDRDGQLTYPLTSQRQAVDFVKLLNRKGFPYQLMCEALNEKPEKFRSWRLGNGNAHIGVNMMKRINKTVQEAMMLPDAETDVNIDDLIDENVVDAESDPAADDEHADGPSTGSSLRTADGPSTGSSLPPADAEDLKEPSTPSTDIDDLLVDELELTGTTSDERTLPEIEITIDDADRAKSDVVVDAAPAAVGGLDDVDGRSDVRREECPSTAAAVTPAAAESATGGTTDDVTKVKPIVSAAAAATTQPAAAAGAAAAADNDEADTASRTKVSDGIVVEPAHHDGKVVSSSDVGGPSASETAPAAELEPHTGDLDKVAEITKPDQSSADADGAKVFAPKVTTNETGNTEAPAGSDEGVVSQAAANHEASSEKSPSAPAPSDVPDEPADSKQSKSVGDAGISTLDSVPCRPAPSDKPSDDVISGVTSHSKPEVTTADDGQLIDQPSPKTKAALAPSSLPDSKTESSTVLDAEKLPAADASASTTSADSPTSKDAVGSLPETPPVSKIAAPESPPVQLGYDPSKQNALLNRLAMLKERAAQRKAEEEKEKKNAGHASSASHTSHAEPKAQTAVDRGQRSTGTKNDAAERREESTAQKTNSRVTDSHHIKEKSETPSVPKSPPPTTDEPKAPAGKVSLDAVKPEVARQTDRPPTTGGVDLQKGVAEKTEEKSVPGSQSKLPHGVKEKSEARANDEPKAAAPANESIPDPKKKTELENKEGPTSSGVDVDKPAVEKIEERSVPKDHAQAAEAKSANEKLKVDNPPKSPEAPAIGKVEKVAVDKNDLSRKVEQVSGKDSNSGEAEQARPVEEAAAASREKPTEDAAKVTKSPTPNAKPTDDVIESRKSAAQSAAQPTAAAAVPERPSSPVAAAAGPAKTTASVTAASSSISSSSSPSSSTAATVSTTSATTTTTSTNVTAGAAAAAASVTAPSTADAAPASSTASSAPSQKPVSKVSGSLPNASVPVPQQHQQPVERSPTAAAAATAAAATATDAAAKPDAPARPRWSYQSKTPTPPQPKQQPAVTSKMGSRDQVEITQDYDSDFDPEGQTSMERLSLIASIGRIKSVNSDGPGFLYVFGEQAADDDDGGGGCGDDAACGRTQRFKIGASRFPAKRLRQAVVFNPDLRSMTQASVAFRRRALDLMRRKLDAAKIDGAVDWFTCTADVITNAINEVTTTLNNK